MVIFDNIKFISGKVARIEMNLGIDPINQITGRYPISFFCVQVKRNGCVNKFNPRFADALNMTRESWFDVFKVLAPLKYAILCNRFRLFDIRLTL